MGIQKLLDVQIDNETTIRSLKKNIQLQNLKICVDSSCIIYKYFYGTFNKNLNAEENFAEYKKYIVNFIQHLTQNNVESIWIFDGDKNIYKYATSKARQKILHNNILKYIKETHSTCSDIKEYTDIVINKKELTLSFSYNDREYCCLNPNPCYHHSKFLIDILTQLGIKYTIANNMEAEYLAVEICKQKYYYGVLSSDTDVLTLGGNLINIEYKDGYFNYFIYYIDEIFKKLSVNHEEFCKMCIMLGCDFCEKTKGIGPKTVLHKFRNITLRQDQYAVLLCFIRNENVSYEIIQRDINFNILREYNQLIFKLECDKDYNSQDCSLLITNEEQFTITYNNEEFTNDIISIPSNTKFFISKTSIAKISIL